MLFVQILNIKDVLSLIMLVNPFFFNDFIAKNSPLDFKFVGANFTWCNACFGSARRFACLDRCLVNLGWIYFFGFYLVFYLSQILSDLAPLLLSVRPRHSTRHKVFLFETFWLEYLDCHSSIHLALNFTPHSNLLHAFSHLLSRTHHSLLCWRSSSLSSLDRDIFDLERHIHSLETKDMANPLFHITLGSDNPSML